MILIINLLDSVLANEIDTELSFNIRPLNFNSFSEILFKSI